MQATFSGSASVGALRERYGERYRWLLLLSVLTGTIASLIPSTSVNVAIPAMSAYFGLGQARAQWITSGFMVASTVSMLTTPWLLTRFGYRATYMGAVLLLMIGAIMGGVAVQFPLVLASRVAEGMAAGIIQPIPAVIILHAFKPHEQGRAGGLFGMGVVLAPAIAPALGGVLTDLLGWRSTFFMVVPVTLLSLWLGLKFVPHSSPGGASVGENAAGLDWIGLTFGAGGTLCLLNGMAQLHQEPRGPALVLLALAVLMLVAFVFWQKRMLARGRRPLMDLRLFRCRPFVMGCIVSAVYGTAMFGSTYLLPLFMQMGIGLSASYAGNLLLPAGLVLALTFPVVGRLADKQPTHWLVSIGLGLLALSFALMIFVGSGTALWLLAAFIAVGRIGLGFILPSLNLGAMRPLDKSLIAQGSSTISFIRMLGGAAGVGLFGIVLQWRMEVHEADPALGIKAAHLIAFHECFVLLTALCLVALAAATRLRSPHPPPDKSE
ncbi:DHA2 family efflux MFS transporter permease subunit [Diaphorobacter aerolatus]|uniref:DHA2 family efflux MFS transporter permease subunit n=1 Tax=Diaphorobacter aerolatus TaxID=1288495 RepID=A0A7H0GPV1_9BURK|nr:DHA2 family efflux MFS transporter permease subunit [Diaphorobacter aerolatus]QNP50317.1 DHA2 family efflux MFS transporter permease subunit [Diaphorobacter aerolatus]